MFFGSLPLSLCGYQRVSGEVLVSVNVMGRCFLWQVCLLLIRAYPSAGPPWSTEEGTGQICLPVQTSLSYTGNKVTTGPRPAPPPRTTRPDKLICWHLLNQSAHYKQCGNLSQDVFLKCNLTDLQVTLIPISFIQICISNTLIGQLGSNNTVYTLKLTHALCALNIMCYINCVAGNVLQCGAVASRLTEVRAAFVSPSQTQSFISSSQQALIALCSTVAGFFLCGPLCHTCVKHPQ